MGRWARFSDRPLSTYHRNRPSLSQVKKSSDSLSNGLGWPWSLTWSWVLLGGRWGLVGIERSLFFFIAGIKESSESDSLAHGVS